MAKKNTGTNPYAGTISMPGDANTIRTSPAMSMPNSFRPQDGEIFGGLDSDLRVQGSSPGMDPRDPQNPNSAEANIGPTDRLGV